MKCFYHTDLDGHCAGAIIRRKYPDCELMAIDYGDPFDIDAMQGEDIFMVDFSLQPYELMRRLNKAARSLTWIDHHVSAIQEHLNALDNGAPRIDGIQRSGEAGCELTWQYFFPHDPMPTAVRLLGRYDVWNFEENSLVLPFQYGMRLMETRPEMAPELWDQLLQEDLNGIAEICAAGHVCLKYQAQQAEKYCRLNALEIRFEGLRFVALNIGKPLVNSQFFEAVYDPQRHDGMLAFYRKQITWEVSLYTERGDLDMSTIAKKHGGGGHKKAAGFQCRLLPFSLPDHE